jgi:GrpB-like predicted nucleotidyltransferase (UPF0157 family)
MPDDRITIEPYDAGWPLAFEAERDAILRVLGALALRIDHHGSTAVPGLAAKPVIDIQISVAQLHPIAVYGERLARLGYVHVPHEDDARCPFFYRPAFDAPHRRYRHHVHVVEAGGDEERRTLAFRDRLRQDPLAARQYEALKRRLASTYDGTTPASMQAYVDGKAEFIDRIVSG